MLNISFDSRYPKEKIKKNLEIIKLECDKIKDYVNIEIFSFEQLDECQVGYSVDPNGNSLVTDDEDTWDENWIVIAYETLGGDPIIIELNEDGYPVSILMHGMDSWDNGSYLADSMEAFLNTLKEISCFLTEKHVLKGKRNIQNKELRAMLDRIIEISNSANFEVWEYLLNPLSDIVEEYEEILETKVKELKKEGKKISEIASLLNIPPKDVYNYIKKIKFNNKDGK